MNNIYVFIIIIISLSRLSCLYLHYYYYYLSILLNFNKMLYVITIVLLYNGLRLLFIIFKRSVKRERST